MVFRRKKSGSGKPVGSVNPRGRDSVGNGPVNPLSPTQNPLARRFQVDDEPDTIDLEQAAEFHDSEDQEQGQSTTRILSGETGKAAPVENEALSDPVSGFLAVISGPGRGSVSILRYGKNSIGRDTSQRVSLDRGDSRISRENHCIVTYDPATRKFYLQPGEGSNLTYLEGQPLLTVMELSAGNHIRIGGTGLRFVPLCTQDFNWED
jgi:pSer/pThr/pTyr-binding forkhead associated (FHA) protein